jgi:hypothetical protein
VASQIRAPHAAALECTRPWSIEQLAAPSQQSLAAIARDASSVAVDRIALGGPLPPISSPARGLGDVAADLEFLECGHHRVAVIALVGDEFSDLWLDALAGRVVGVAPHFLEILVGFLERVAERRRLAFGTARDRHAEHGAGVHVDGLLLLVGEARAGVLHLHDLRVGIGRAAPVVVRALLGALAVDSRETLARRRRDARGLREAIR